MVDNPLSGNDPLDDLEPEMKDGPLGLPYVKPKGLPDLPDDGGLDVFDDDY